ncbi:MAG: hypothetical protein PHH82_02680 [Candidatus ainarchaeum sp.]|nr:hypothetical protein [Candidatus ainarchaeum sp.]
MWSDMTVDINKVKEFIFIGLIAILFTSLVFYASNIFFKTNDYDDCYSKVKPVYDINGFSPQQAEMDACYKDYQTAREAKEKNKLLLINIITIVILVGVIFLTMDIFINGLFYGALLSSIIANIAFYNSDSIIALILGIIIFVELGILIKVKMKKIQKKGKKK